MKRILLPLCLLLTLHMAAQKTAKRELRGAWITTYLGLDWPVRTQTPATQRTNLITILDHHLVTGINTVYFQVRSQSDAMYPSTIEPWSYDLTGQQNVAPNPAWDPLQFALDESRKRGFEFHAWLNPFRAVANTANAGNAAMFSSAHISKTHPQWMLTVGTQQILNPGIPAVRAYVTSVVADLITRYDIDGIHFDDYFYPNGTINDNDAYLADPRGFPNTTAGRADWRRDNINLFIQGIYNLIKSTKPWIKFGVSPTGIYRSSTNPEIGSPTSSGALQHYVNLFADTKKWLQEGWVDYIAPQLYWFIGQTGSDYSLLLPWWNNNAFGRHIYIGMATYKVNDAAQGAAWTSRSQYPSQMRMNQDPAYANVLGSIHFRTQFLRNNPLNVRDSLRDRFYMRPALQPTMPWNDAQAPDPATGLKAVRFGNDSVVLQWQKPAATSNMLDKAWKFVIYRSTQPNIDIENPQYIYAITLNDTAAFRDVSISAGSQYYYVVTAIDRYHNESAVSNEANTLPPQVVCPGQQVVVLGPTCSVALPDYRNLVTVNGMAAAMATDYTITQSPAPGTMVSGPGSLQVTITAADRGGNSGNCQLTVMKQDVDAPVISNASANPAVLNVPNHKMRTVQLQYQVADNCGPVTTTLSVTHNEMDANGAGNTAVDWEIVNNNTVKLRAERSGTGNGRIYTITITSVDGAGNSSQQEVYVTVPHNQGNNAVTRVQPVAGGTLMLAALPNPSATAFQVKVDGRGDAPVQLVVRNVLGQEVERVNGLRAGTTIQLGAAYEAGIYLVEAIQGESRTVLRLVKR